MKIRPTETELFHADGRKDTKLTAAFRNFGKQIQLARILITICNRYTKTGYPLKIHDGMTCARHHAPYYGIRRVPRFACARGASMRGLIRRHSHSSHLVLVRKLVLLLGTAKRMITLHLRIFTTVLIMSSLVTGKLWHSTLFKSSGAQAATKLRHRFGLKSVRQGWTNSRRLVVLMIKFFTVFSKITAVFPLTSRSVLSLHSLSLSLSHTHTHTHKRNKKRQENVTFAAHSRTVSPQ
jgi:hypothetical protein